MIVRMQRAEFGVDFEKKEVSPMATGTVKFFDTTRGFGFIQPDEGGKDVFVHATAVEAAGMATLQDGQKVNFAVTTQRGKPAASDLSPA